MVAGTRGPLSWVQESRRTADIPRMDALLPEGDCSPDDLRLALEESRTRLAAVQAQLFESEAKYTALLEELPAAIYIDEPDANGKTLFISPNVEQVLGVTAEQYMAGAAEWDQMVHPDDRARIRAEYEAFLLSGEFATGDYRFIRPDGSTVWIHDRSHMVHGIDGKQAFVQGVMFDITEQKELESRLAHLAYHDVLTDLPNRAMFGEHLELSLARAERRGLGVAVLFVDLDDFKGVNDSFGHTVGDELLKVVGARLVRATRATDLVARQSGDEFLILMSDLETGVDGATAREAVEIVLGRIAGAFADPALLSGHEVSASASAGFAIYPYDGRSERDLLRQADARMYERKRRSGSAA